MEYLENQAGSKEKLYIHSITLSGSQGSIIENRSREVSYTAKGKLVVPNGLDEARKRFRQNAVISESLKGRCRELHMDKKTSNIGAALRDQTAFRHHIDSGRAGENRGNDIRWAAVLFV